MKNKCIIIGAGDLTVSDIATKEEDYIIAVDGGMMYLGVLGIEPDIIIGDFDSVEGEYLQAIEKIETKHPEKVIRLNKEKDDTDMLAALRYGLEKGYKDFEIYAGLGGRLDHTIANIQCLLYLKNHDATGYLKDGNGIIFVMKDESVSFKESMEGYVSLFALGDRAEGVTLEGLKYPLDKYTITNDFPIGISNEFVGVESKITVEHGQLAVIVQWG